MTKTDPRDQRVGFNDKYGVALYPGGYRISCVTYEGEAPECAECGTPMRLRNGQFGAFWGCPLWPACECTHQAHPDGSPVGTPADRETRELRSKGHRLLEDLGKILGNGASTLYPSLALRMKLPREQCHFGKFTKEQCLEAVRILEEIIDPLGSQMTGDEWLNMRQYGRRDKPQPRIRKQKQKQASVAVRPMPEISIPEKPRRKLKL